MPGITIVIPAFNEEDSIRDTVQMVRDAFESTDHETEIIVVNDGSTDRTQQEAEEADVKVITHPTNSGYGNALLTGVRNATHSWIGITDADGTYPIEEMPSMLEEASGRDLDMLIGARQGKHYKGSKFKWVARIAFKWLSEFATGNKIPDINSGLRVMRRDMIMRFAPILSGGFSFTTTITIIAFLTYHFVEYRPVKYHARKGASHVRYVRDTMRSAQIIVMTILFFNPIKLFILHAAFLLISGIVAFLLSVAFPDLTSPILVLSLFFLVANILLGMGFLAEQRRVHLANVKIPERGYTPNERR